MRSCVVSTRAAPKAMCRRGWGESCASAPESLAPAMSKPLTPLLGRPVSLSSPPSARHSVKRGSAVVGASMSYKPSPPRSANALPHALATRPNYHVRRRHPRRPKPGNPGNPFRRDSPVALSKPPQRAGPLVHQSPPPSAIATIETYSCLGGSFGLLFAQTPGRRSWSSRMSPSRTALSAHGRHAYPHVPQTLASCSLKINRMSLGTSLFPNRMETPVAAVRPTISNHPPLSPPHCANADKSWFHWRIWGEWMVRKHGG